MYGMPFAASENRATVHSFVGQSEAFGEILGGIALGTLAQLTQVFGGAVDAAQRCR